MKHRKYRILSILLLACLALQAVIPGAWAEAAPEGWETLAPAETAAPEEGTDPTGAPEGPTDAPEVTEEPTAPPQEETEPEATEEPTEAPEPTEPEPTEPDPLEGYTFPDNWAREPLMFAVRNGILQGRGDYNLDPTGRTTRAEMAAMLVRLLGAKEQGDLSPYRDLDPAAWYNRELSAAVSLGIFNGVSATQMAPMRSITRQEAFTVLARAFGLYPQNRRAYTRFRDGEKVQPYARDAVSALAEVGCVTGYDTGYLKPRDPISRQEVAALFYKLLDQICDDPQELPETGFVLYRGTEPLPQGYRLEGSLVLGAGLSGSQTVTEIQVTDRLILRCATGTELTLEAVSAGEVSVASCLTATGEGTFPLLVSAGSGAEVALDAVRLEVFGPGVLSGDYETASVHCSGAVLSGEVDRLTATAAGATVEVRGQAGEVLLPMERTRLTGSGYAGSVVVQGRHCVVELAYGELVDQVDWGLEGLQVQVTGPASISANSPKAVLTAKFTNFTAGYGCTDGARTCQVVWFLNGKLLGGSSSFTLREGATATCTKTFDRAQRPEQDPVFTVVLTCGGETVRAQYTVKVDRERWDYETALETVQGVNIEAEVLRRTPLYGDRSMSYILQYLPQGTALTHLYYSQDPGTPGQVRLADGTVGWVNWDDYLVSRTDYTQGEDYSTATKEGFVNQKGYSGPTGYLLWISLKTQRVNIFQGSKGNWKLIRSSPCSTGTNLTPTVTGVFSVIYKTYRWRFSDTIDGQYIDDYYRVYHITGFWGGQAFHSRPYRSSDESLLDGTMGTPSSHGCVRMYDEDCSYIYDEIPYDTTVVVF